MPRTFVYLRALRAQPPAAPRNLTRLPAHASYGTTESPEAVLERARALLGRKRYRLRRDDDGDAVSAERGYLREVGNLLFHLAVLVVLVGFALGSLFGYKGGVILVTGHAVQQQPHAVRRLRAGQPLRRRPDGPVPLHRRRLRRRVAAVGAAGGDGARLRRRRCATRRRATARSSSYDLRVNHPLTIGGTELFLIGHGYAPVVTVRDGDGRRRLRPGRTVFLPQGPDLFSFGVVKAPDAKPGQIGLEGFFYPTFANVDGDPVNLGGDDVNPLLSLNVWTGDLNLDSGASQSVYVLDKSKATPLPGKNGQPLRIDLAPGDTVELPDGLGQRSPSRRSCSWQRIQISQTPGKGIALLGVVLALLGLMGSLFIRSRRVWVRVDRGRRTARWSRWRPSTAPVAPTPTPY